MTANLGTSLAQGRMAMSGQGLDPATLYGAPSATEAPALTSATTMPLPPAAAPSMPPSPGTPGTAALYGVPSVSAGVAVGGATSAAALPGTEGGSASTATAPHVVHSAATTEDIANFLMPKIGDVESMGQKDPYRAVQGASSASGKYQYTKGTWGGYGGYSRAADAPPEVQDQRMKEDLGTRLNHFGGDPFKAVVAHYYPAWANDPSKWNNIPVHSNGKTIQGAETPASYAGKVLGANRVSSYLASQQPQPAG